MLPTSIVAKSVKIFNYFSLYLVASAFILTILVLYYHHLIKYYLIGSVFFIMYLYISYINIF